MNDTSIFILKAMRKLYASAFKTEQVAMPLSNQDPEAISKIIFDALQSDEPCMIARFGSTEMACLCNILGIKYHRNKVIGYIKGKTQPWWWESSVMNQMQKWSGFFPPTHDKLEEFGELMFGDMVLVDILGSWLSQEVYFEDKLTMANLVRFIYLEPFWSKSPWTKALEGKKVLVIHPFAKTIEKQYSKRSLLFDDNLLPKFELTTIKAVQSIAGSPTGFKDWFEALKFMEGEIDKKDYDICLIGAGAYGFPLAAHVKRMGKKGFHLGGSLQLLFGIKGKRWEDKNYGSGLNLNYLNLFNEHWIRAGEEEIPQNSKSVENGCYW